MNQSMKSATGLGVFLSKRESMNNQNNDNHYHSYNSSNFSFSPDKDDAGTIATVSVLTEATPFTNMSVTSHDDHVVGSDAASFQSGSNQAEKVWFGSLTDRFHRFSVGKTAIPTLDDAEHDHATHQQQHLPQEYNPQEGQTSGSSSVVSLLRGEPPHAPRAELFNETTNHAAFAQFHKESHAHLKKKVSFDPEPPQVHPSPYGTLTPDEQESLWYDEEVIEFFRESNMVGAKALFFNTNNVSDGTQRERVRGFVEFYHFCVNQAAAEQEEDKRRSSPDKKKKSHKDAKRLAKHRKRLAQVYHRDNVLGLESFVLTATRGGPKHLRQFIVDHSHTRIQREILLGEEEEQHDISMDSGTATATTPYHHMDQQAKILAQVSLAVSRPSCILAHEMAVAHAHTLSRDYDDAALLLNPQQRRTSRMATHQMY